MPKIIKDLESKLIDEAKRQIEEAGYASMTIRSVAKACGVGVGTVYNYFPGKDDLVASFMLTDWQQCITAIHAVGAYCETPEPVCRCIYDRLLAFARLHEAVFRDEAAASAFAGSFSRYHSMLRSQLAQPLLRFCENDFTAHFAAEGLLTWTMAGKDFDEIYGILGKLFG